MEFHEVVRRRRMWRNFEERAVPDDVLDRILSVAVRAPSAGFTQGWGFLVLTDEPDRERFWKANWPEDERDGPHQTVMRAPVVIVPMANKQAYLDRYAEPDKGWTDRAESRWPAPFWDIDTGFASMLIMLAAVDAGLGSLFFGIWRGDEVCAAFDVPADFRPIGAIALGYPAQDVGSPSLKRGRRSVNDVVHRGRWR